jgi:hypothetical protein
MRTNPTEAAIRERRRRVARLYIQQRTQYEIAALVGVNQGTVSRDLEVIRQEWQASAVMDLGTRKAQELARIDRIEAEAWAAWERSVQDAKMYHVETTSGMVDGDGRPLPDRTRKRQTQKGQAGDPRFLERVGWCIEQRCRILGMNAPEKHEYSGSLTLEQRRDRLLAVLDHLRGRGSALPDGGSDPAGPERN